MPLVCVKSHNSGQKVVLFSAESMDSAKQWVRKNPITKSRRSDYTYYIKEDGHIVNEITDFVVVSMTLTNMKYGV